MTRRQATHSILAAAGALAISAFAYAQTFNVKPGLWETTTQGSMGGMPQMPQVDTSKMTPEQAAMVAAAMARAGGAGGPRSSTVKKCWTKEEIEKNQFTGKELEEGCTEHVVSRTATSIEVKFECTNPDHPATGTVKITSADPEHVSGTTAMSITGGRGAGMSMNSTFTSKWLGADCGSAK
jgi:Protein of unknown function (DUF3617)